MVLFDLQSDGNNLSAFSGLPHRPTDGAGGHLLAIQNAVGLDDVDDDDDDEEYEEFEELPVYEGDELDDEDSFGKIYK